MSDRPVPYTIAPHLMQPLIDYSSSVTKLGLEPSLMELVKIRASQINGCAVCLAMHAAEARKAGETEARILMLDAWRETELYTPRERAALAWTESLTRLSETKAPDADYEMMAAEFDPEEQVKLTLLIGVINSFNRIGAGFHVPPMPIHLRAAA
jgi:AhpD family alkylhydroperoxidase